MKSPTKRQDAEARTAKVASTPNRAEICNAVEFVTTNPAVRQYTAEHLDGYASSVFESYKTVKAMAEHERGFTHSMRN